VNPRPEASDHANQDDQAMFPPSLYIVKLCVFLIIPPTQTAPISPQRRSHGPARRSRTHNSRELAIPGPCRGRPARPKTGAAPPTSSRCHLYPRHRLGRSAHLPVGPPAARRLGRRPVLERHLAGRLQLDGEVVPRQHVAVSSPAAPPAVSPSRGPAQLRRHRHVSFRCRHRGPPRWWLVRELVSQWYHVARDRRGGEFLGRYGRRHGGVFRGFGLPLFPSTAEEEETTCQAGEEEGCDGGPDADADDGGSTEAAGGGRGIGLDGDEELRGDGYRGAS